MGVKNFLRDRYNQISSLSSLAGGVVTGAMAAPGLGPGSILVGAAVGGTALVGATLFRPRTEEEIRNLLGPQAVTPKAEKKELALQDSRSVLINGILSEVDGINTADLPSQRFKVRSILNLASMRKTALGEDNLNILIDLMTKMTWLINEEKFLSANEDPAYTFQSILFQNLPETLDIFYSTPVADPNQRAEFQKKLNVQLETLDSAVKSLVDQAIHASHKRMDVNGHYLTSKFTQG